MNYQQAKTLGIESNWSQYYLSSMAFLNNSSIWQKKKVSVKSEYQKIFKSQKFQFFKVGKTFGFETSRYIEYINGILYYYEVTYKNISREKKISNAKATAFQRISTCIISKQGLISSCTSQMEQIFLLFISSLLIS